MTAGPPPSLEVQFDRLGVEVGLVYGIASLAVLGALALIFPIIGYLAGRIFGALVQ